MASFFFFLTSRWECQRGGTAAGGHAPTPSVGLLVHDLYWGSVQRRCFSWNKVSGGHGRDATMSGTKHSRVLSEVLPYFRFQVLQTKNKNTGHIMHQQTSSLTLKVTRKPLKLFLFPSASGERARLQGLPSSVFLPFPVISCLSFTGIISACFPSTHISLSWSSRVGVSSRASCFTQGDLGVVVLQHHHPPTNQKAGEGWQRLE